MAKNAAPMNSLEGLFDSALEYGESMGFVRNNKSDNACQMKLRKLHTFKNHPYLVLDDESMMELAESIKEHGLIEPILVRPHPDIKGDYEIVSGHRRRHACEINGMDEVTVVIRDMDDRTAIEIMVDSNNKRPNLLPSEMAKAYRMKYDAAKSQGKRTDLDDGERYCVEEHLGQDMAKESKRQINRYVRLSYLIDPLLKLVDDKKIAFNAGVELSHLGIAQQEIVCEYGLENKKYPSLTQAGKLKDLFKQGEEFTGSLIDKILNPKKEKAVKIVLKSDELSQYFEPGTSAVKMEEVIYELLKEWQRQKKSQENQEK